jgi:hypothetical protein
MSNIWERFEGIATAEEVLQAAYSNKPLKEGTYQMILKSIELGESRENALPMLKGEFVMVDGGRKVYYNQVLQNLNYPQFTPQNIANAVNFLSGLTGLPIEAIIKDFDNTVDNVEREAEHTVKVSYGKNDANKKYPILEVIRLEDVEVGEDEEF